MKNLILLVIFLVIVVIVLIGGWVMYDMATDVTESILNDFNSLLDVSR